jgi:hypothetical protein
MKLFTVGGHSILPCGTKKVRAANDMMRVKKLADNGHTEIFLEELPHPMTKEQIAERYGFTVKAAKPKAVKAAAVVEAEAVETEEDAAEDTVKWLEKGEEPAVDEDAVTYKTFEEALAAVPLRSDKGHFIKKEVREALARDMVAA